MKNMHACIWSDLALQQSGGKYSDFSPVLKT